MKLSLGLDQAYRKGIALGFMRGNSATEASSAPVFIEVLKPVNLMTPSEKDDFIEEILKALEGK